MTLANRVAAYFLGWLGVSLVGFAIAVYLIARADLYREADARLEGTLNTLAAAADVEPDGIEWEGPERRVPRSDAPNDVHWIVVTTDSVIDRSGPAAGRWLMAEDDPASDPRGEPWRVARRRLEARNDPNRPPDHRTLANEPQRVIKHRAIEIYAGLPLTPIHTELRRLAIWLAIPSIGTWLAAALVGRRLCRRTLAPVAEMAKSAGAIGPSAAGERLTVRPTGDELEDLGRAFNGALDRLEEALERQRRFTGDASHQLRTPLAAMLGQVEVALRRDRDASEYRATLASLAEDIRHLNRLTESLLFLARADAEAAVPHLQEIDLSTWVATYAVQWRAQHSESRLDVIVVDPRSSPVRAHPELLAQLLDNLLDNALKYSPTGSPITLRISGRDGGTELAVEDQGPGIAPADLPHLFEPFFRSAAAREAGIRGVGLGLAIAKRIAESMGARLSTENLPGVGSRFVAWFPAR
jgi:two-component system, OmpR family, sensor kinase